MKRLFALFVCLAAFGLSLTLPFAQAVADDPVLSSERIDGLISMIENEGERTVFVERLKVLTALDDTTEPVTGFTERARMVVTESLTAVGSRLEHATKAMTDLPATVRELVGALSEKEMLIALGLALAVSLGLLGIGAMAGMIVSFSYARLPMSGKGAVRYAFRRFLACLFGLAVFYLIVVGGAIVAFQVMGERPEAFAFMIAIVHSMVLVGLVIALTRAILAPDGKGPRLPKLTDETAAYMQIWVRRFVLVWLLGVIMVSTVRLPIDLTGLDGTALIDPVRQVFALALTLLMLIFILQNRHSVAVALTRLTTDLPEQIPGRARLEKAAGHLAAMARIWHMPTIVFLVAVWGAWAFHVDGGALWLIRAALLSLLILAVARLVARGIGRIGQRLFALTPEMKQRLPGLERRAGRYLSVFIGGLHLVVWIAATLLVLRVWGVDSFAWLGTDTGHALVERGLTVGVVLVLAFIIWETVSNAIERYLSNGGAERSARTRTLLPLMRNAFMVLLVTIVSLIVLSEIGIDIAPLLAGAGVIGLAIGFGAQTLVKDVITGLFILIEDSIQVGDVASVGGHAGLVEAISIRTIRLRDLSGAVHTVPYSSVTTVQNLTKGFSFYVFNIGVAYRENVDNVMAVMKDVGADLRADVEFGPMILEDFEVLGLDDFADSAIVIKARFKTKALKQWTVGREYNRRLKNRFDAEGIEIPFPHTTLYFGQDKDGKAPPANLAVESMPC